MSDESSVEEEETEVLFVAEEQSSGEDPPMSEWSSLEVELPEENKKKLLFTQNLYSAGSGELCAKYVKMFDSQIVLHPYYSYPAVSDPGIKKALLGPEKPVIYPDDGQALYLFLCEDMNTFPVRMFHKNLLSNEIDLSFYGVSPAAVRPMAMALQYNKYVQIFNLTDNFLTDDSSYHLGQMLSSNITLKELNLTGCRIGASGMLRLGNTLSVNRTLTTLNLSRNYIGEAGGLHFAHQILGAAVKNVNLSYNQLGKQTALAFAEAFEFNNKLTHLDLSKNNFFHAATTVKMLDVLAQSKVLQELNLAWNSLEGERVAGGIKNILLVPSLTSLDLSNNRLQGEAILVILTNLYRAKKLVTLHLSFNPMSPEDAQATIEKMLKPRVKLENLFLENVSVNKSFLTCLSRVMRMKTRKNFSVKYGRVLQNWSVQGPDPRELILRRADHLGKARKKRKVDMAQFFLQLNKEFPRPMTIKELLERIELDEVPLDDGLVNELCVIFPGPKSVKTKYINLQLICEFMERIWPDRKLPPTPPPEPEPEPVVELPPPPPPKKGKGKK
ncbi:hypothetical protein O3G_MSEX006066 [Manduca sexta]|uniref:Uncharacterized protein n=1 Tax=Manduca sexta TaxID=7130 RepID=A0A922CKD9_MANSE|nr:hypothetical protein O3G_MSEX006066 [Manduca sexta]